MSYSPKLERHYIFKRNVKTENSEFDIGILSLADRAVLEAHHIDNKDKENRMGWVMIKMSYFPSIEISEEEYRKRVNVLVAAKFKYEISDSEGILLLMDDLMEEGLPTDNEYPECEYLSKLLK